MRTPSLWHAETEHWRLLLSIEPSLLYLLGANPEDPVVVCNGVSLEIIFSGRHGANKLELRRKLYALRLKDGESVQEHIKKMTEIFENLSVIDDPVSDEDRVVHLLASLPDSFEMLVTALEANSETIPRMEVVTERLLHEEQKQKEKEAANEERKALAAKGSSKQPGHYLRRVCAARSQHRVAASNRNIQGDLHGPICHFCRKPGHLKREC